jgi:AcrR family transcriptional regulator
MSSETALHTTLDYTRHLAGQADSVDGLSKGERSRLRIMAAASRILAEKGYHDLRMADIAMEAGVSHGAVYRYFKNKRDITFDVLQGMGTWSLEYMLASPETSSAFQRILLATGRFIELCRANIGLFRCLRQLCDEYQEFDELQMKNNARWYRMVASGLTRRAATTERAAEVTFGVASALGGMVDEMLFNVFVREDPNLAHFRRAPAKLATLLAVLWYRAAYVCNPPTDEVEGAQALLELRGADGDLTSTSTEPSS